MAETKTFIGHVKGEKGDTGEQGQTGVRGSRWNSGTLITGTSTTPTSFPTGISDALVNDNYLNTENGNTYRCVESGDATTAKWIYTGCLKGADGERGTAMTETTVEGWKALPDIKYDDDVLYELTNGYILPNSRCVKHGTNTNVGAELDALNNTLDNKLKFSVSTSKTSIIGIFDEMPDNARWSMYFWNQDQFTDLPFHYSGYQFVEIIKQDGSDYSNVYYKNFTHERFFEGRIDVTTRQIYWEEIALKSTMPDTNISSIDSNSKIENGHFSQNYNIPKDGIYIFYTAVRTYGGDDEITYVSGFAMDGVTGDPTSGALCKRYGFSSLVFIEQLTAGNHTRHFFTDDKSSGVILNTRTKFIRIS